MKGLLHLFFHSLHVGHVFLQFVLHLVHLHMLLLFLVVALSHSPDLRIHFVLVTAPGVLREERTVAV